MLHQLRLAVYPIINDGLYDTSQVVGLGISEPSAESVVILSPRKKIVQLIFQLDLSTPSCSGPRELSKEEVETMVPREYTPEI